MRNAPPLLKLMQGHRALPRQVLRARTSEIALHLAVADVLKKYCLPEWRWTHFPAGEARDARTGAKLKKMGLQRGWPDFVLLRPARGARRSLFYGLELKRAGEVLTDEQEAFAAWCKGNSLPFAVAHSIDEALTILGEWRCLRINLAQPARPHTAEVPHA